MAAEEVSSYIPGQTSLADHEDAAFAFLEAHCVECHDDLQTEAGLNLLDLGPVDETNLATWKAVWAQVALEQMPPSPEEGASSQPADLERLKFTDWIVGSLKEELADRGGFPDADSPKKGNFIPHRWLFDALPEGVEIEPTYSPARLWRITPQEHITRLNELINREPDFDPKAPGKRTRGDFIPVNHGGELKLYFGTDRIIWWQGGTVAYATAVKSVPVVLTDSEKYGFKNYASGQSVNGAEATQILSKAEAILRYMAYGPLSIAKPEQITDRPGTYQRLMPRGDNRGLLSSIVYSTKEVRPDNPLRRIVANPEEMDDAAMNEAIAFVFHAVTFRPATDEQIAAYRQVVKATQKEIGAMDGLFMGLSAIFLDRAALFRSELGQGAELDEHGRFQLRDWELALALNHTLSYLKPDEQLHAAVLDGRMRTRADVDREITRMLRDPGFRKPRVLQFFRDFFDYDLADRICKDRKSLTDAGITLDNTRHSRAMLDARASTDRLIERALARDQDVLKTLLLTQEVIAGEYDHLYFGRRLTWDERRAELDARKARETAIRKKRFPPIKALKAELKALSKAARRSEASIKEKEATLAKLEREMKTALVQAAEKSVYVEEASLPGSSIYARASRRTFGDQSMSAERTLTKAPAGQRLGILTHPSWLVSHSDAMDNHAIHRGIWIRERLLGGGIPDVPITVDAQLPDEPDSTLREKMRVTRAEYCWSCHEKMDPLGLPFEMFNHAGLYRPHIHNDPVDTSGEIIDSGDPTLDGPVEDALEMIDRLAHSEHVEQVFVRHAFRFWMGRNETLHDAPVLRAAHAAYRDSGGSMRALIRSLVLSDAFLYRRAQ